MKKNPYPGLFYSFYFVFFAGDRTGEGGDREGGRAGI